MSKISKEKDTVEKMISLYCRKMHGGEALCEDCMQLKSYAHDKLTMCRFGEAKGVCKQCKVHCYKPAMRIKIREVMRFSGPRFVFYYPRDFVRHLLKQKRLK